MPIRPYGTPVLAFQGFNQLRCFPRRPECPYRRLASLSNHRLAKLQLFASSLSIVPLRQPTRPRRLDPQTEGAVRLATHGLLQLPGPAAPNLTKLRAQLEGSAIRAEVPQDHQERGV